MAHNLTEICEFLRVAGLAYLRICVLKKSLAKEFLADVGIALVIEPHFKKTELDGAAMLDSSVPIVALTLRHDRLDNYWFAVVILKDVISQS